MNLKKDEIICGDCLSVLKTLPDSCADLVFADPPYFLRLGKKDLLRPDATPVQAVRDTWDSFKNPQEYDSFCTAWLREIYRVLKPTGTLWIIGSYHNIYKIGAILQDLGWWILNDVVWIKTNPLPNFKGTRLTNAHETLLWCAKSPDAKYTFNYEAMKMFNDGKQLRSDWYFPLCQGAERIKDEAGQTLHSTQKPLALLYRIILASTNKGDLIIDPFFGTGTTGVAAKQLGRHFIGIEKEKKYISYATKRIKEAPQIPDKYMEITTKKPPQRISFGALLESGMLSAGDVLTDAKKRFQAVIRPDGSVQTDSGFVGSIHQAAVHVHKSSDNNGWTFWHVKDKKDNLIALDAFRKKFLHN